MNARTYPVPLPLQPFVGAGALAEVSLRRLAATSSAEEGDWARGVVQRLDRSVQDRRRAVLTAGGWSPDSGISYYGLVDEYGGEDDPGEAVTGLVAFDPLSGHLMRWEGSGWAQIPEEMEPAGMSFVVLDTEPEFLADLMEALSGGSRGIALRPTAPRARVAGRMLSEPALCAAAVATEVLFAVVDDLDTSAVLDVFRVVPGPKAEVRKNGAWKEDKVLLGLLRSVDPPRVVRVPPESVPDVLRSLDDYDAEHPSGKASPEEEKEYAAAHPESSPTEPLVAPPPQGALAAGANPPATSRMDRDLRDYWTHGKGALKIRWGTSGDFNRCTRALAKYLPPTAVHGACANLHKLATGSWPGRKAKH
jgi:hypothetical protein